MPIDIDKLRAFAVPGVRQTLTPNDIALFALSVGLGRDPLDTRQLPFVDPLKGPPVLPGMVLVMAHPGFWLSHPDSGVDPKAVLHAAQDFEIEGPLPRAGDTVESRTRVTDVFDRGEGRPALILSETALLDAACARFARLTRTTLIRNGGGFGGPSGPGKGAAAQDAPATPPDRVIDLTTGREQALIYRLNGDLNPLHSDPEIARAAGFEAPILHGLCTMGVVTHALLDALAGYDPDRLRRVRLKFTKPVYPGETIRTEIWQDGRFRARVVERDAIVIDDGLAETAPDPSPDTGA